MKKNVVLKPDAKKGFDFKGDEEPAKPKRKNYSWSKLLARVFKIDVETCPCGGKLVPVAKMMKIDQIDQIERYLRHIGEDSIPPVRGPPRRGESELFGSDGEYSNADETEPVIYLD